MTRRIFFKQLCGIAMALAISSVLSRGTIASAKKLRGHLVAGKNPLPDGMAIYLNGENVNVSCTEVDFDEGWCELFPVTMNAEGYLQIVGSKTYRAYGVIELRPEPSAN